MSPAPNKMDVADRRFSVVGSGRSGKAAAVLLARHGADVFVTEQNEIDDATRKVFSDAGIGFEEGGHTPQALKTDCIVLSPGVPSTAPLVVAAIDQRVPVLSEIEIGYRFCPARIIAVTGSNGKTTTTSLLGHIFDVAGRPARVAGNIGLAFCEIADDTGGDEVVILEVSSFQLDHIEQFRPYLSVLLNITPDHLDRYENNLDAYAASKYRVFENQRDGDWIVFNGDDERVRTGIDRVDADRGATKIAISLSASSGRGGHLSNDTLTINVHGVEDHLMHVNEVALRGRHNLYNSLAAAVAARVMEIQSDLVRESLMTFKGVPHRLEVVREVGGVEYVNDSKATNVNSLWYALESFDQPVVLIAGGRDKGNDYSEVRELVRTKVRGLVSIGESADKVLSALGDVVDDAVTASSMEQALEFARYLAKPGDVVLLSPACASFDMFEDFVERGNTFKRIVQEMV